MIGQTQPIPERVTLLTPEDSKRVADALIEAIAASSDFDIASAVSGAVSDMMQPITRHGWKQDWFPLLFEDMCDKIARGVTDAAYRAAERRK